MPWPTDDAVERARKVLASSGGYSDEHGPAFWERDAGMVLEAAALPELFGVKDAAEEYGVRTGNLDRIAGLPAPVYGPELDPPYRLRSGRLWLADEIRAHAASRRAGRDLHDSSAAG